MPQRDLTTLVFMNGLVLYQDGIAGQHPFRQGNDRSVLLQCPRKKAVLRRRDIPRRDVVTDEYMGADMIGTH